MIIIEDYFEIKIPTIFAHCSGSEALAFPILNFKELSDRSRYREWRMAVKGEIEDEGTKLW